jgi:hypothetical protein
LNVISTSPYLLPLRRKLPACEFVVEYLICGKDLNFENTSYFGFICNIGKVYNWDINYPEGSKGQAIKWCEKLTNTVEFSKKHDDTVIAVFELCEGTYMIMNGHHRASCAYAQGKPITLAITDEIKKFWPELSEEHKLLIDKVFEVNYPHLKYYYPPFWEEEKDKLVRESTSRLNAILKDIITLKGVYVSSSLGRNFSRVLEIGCCTGFFSSAIDQIPAMRVTAVDSDPHFINIIRLRREFTKHPFNEVIKGTVRDIKEEFDASLFIDVFFQILMKDGLEEAQYQFERICELTKERIYFGLGMPGVLNKYGALSDFHRKILSKYGFNNVEMKYFGRNENSQYKRAIFVAKK